jgi:hypothetical protein
MHHSTPTRTTTTTNNNNPMMNMMNRQARISSSSDTLRLVILAGTVLFVFWSGVAIGFGFSHSSERHDLSSLLIRSRPISSSSRLNHNHNTIIENQITTSSTNNNGQNQQQQPPESSSSSSSSSMCCKDEQRAECVACQLGVTVPILCLERSRTLKGCTEHVPQPVVRFDGREIFAESFPLTPFDYPSVSISLWFNLADDSNQMKTLLANRESGCAFDTKHHGYALYVNEWDTNDRSIVLMWCPVFGLSSCEKVVSPPNIVIPGRWHHVIMVLEEIQQGGNGNGDSVSSTTATIYLDGVRVAQKTTQNVGRFINRGENSFVLGAHTVGEERHPWKGKIAHVGIGNGVHGHDWVKVAYPNYKPWGENTHQITAYFPMLDIHGKEASKNSGIILKFGGNGNNNAAAFITTPAPTVHFEYVIPPPTDLKLLISGTWPVGMGSPGGDDSSLTPEILRKSDLFAKERRESIRNAMKHAWSGYETHAFGADELAPRSGSPRNNWGGMGVTLVDGVDTLWVLGMKTEFYRARDWVRDKLNWKNVHQPVSVFETTIRMLGGLLSAYDLSGDRAFLDKARELGDRLLPAFGTGAGLPVPQISLQNGHSGSGGQVVLAEIGTVQLEFRALSHHTGDPKYAIAVEKVHKSLRKHPPANGLWPIYADASTGEPRGSQVTFGALGDSFFEYLLKIWLQGGRTEKEYLDDYEKAMDGLHSIIVQKSSPSGLTYLGDLQGYGSIAHKMDHLACFVPGMLALGAVKRPGYAPDKKARDMRVAKALMYTCWQMYERQATGISPEYVTFGSGADFIVPGGAPFYILRPETLESLFILHRITKHPIYRDWSFRIFLSIERHCKTTYGYGALPDVRRVGGIPDDRMESFFFAETIKYLYLAQDSDNEVNLDDWVFNTECHPLKVLPAGWRKKLGLE